MPAKTDFTFVTQQVCHGDAYIFAQLVEGIITVHFDCYGMVDDQYMDEFPREELALYIQHYRKRAQFLRAALEFADPERELPDDADDWLHYEVIKSIHRALKKLHRHLNG